MTPEPDPNTPPYTSPPITIILTIVLLVFFFVGFFSICFCRCLMENLLYTWYFRRTPAGTPVGPTGASGGQGLDPSIIHTFPTFPYSSVKGLRKEKYGLECAICLCEFRDDDILRMLTICCHVFHQECIDLWLESHKSCPVCRRSLDEPEKSPEQSPGIANNGAMQEINENAPMEDTLSITIKDKDDNEGGRGGPESSGGQDDDGEKTMEKFSRSHSTGHSIVRNTTSGEDKFTLRLPEHLHAKLVRGHNWTGSCTTFGEYKSKTSTGNGGFGEASDFSGGVVHKV